MPTSRPLTPKEMKDVMKPMGTTAARPTGRQGKVRTAKMNPTVMKKRTGA